MALTNLKSLILKLNTATPERITDKAFRNLYKAIKDVVEEWDGATTEQKNAYYQKYGIDNYLYIEGYIMVNSLYIKELYYVCNQINGSPTALSGTVSGDHGNLIISPGYLVYIELSDPLMHQAMVNTIPVSGNQDGVIFDDIETFRYATKDYETFLEEHANGEPSYFGNHIDRLVLEMYVGETLEVKRNIACNLPDYFLFSKEAVENNFIDTDTDPIYNIDCYDFIPYYRMIREYAKTNHNSLFGWNINSYLLRWVWPLILSPIPGICQLTLKKRQISEMWMFLPFEMGATSNVCSGNLVLTPGIYDIFDKFTKRSDDDYSQKHSEYVTLCNNAANTYFSSDVNRITIKKWFYHGRSQFGSDRLVTNWVNKTYIFEVTDLCWDGWEFNLREFQDGFGWQGCIHVTNFIILNSMKDVPPAELQFENDADAIEFLSDPSKIRRISNLYDKYIMSDSDKMVNGIYNLAAFVYTHNTWFQNNSSYIYYVPDEVYYLYKYMNRVYNADGTAPVGTCPFNPINLRRFSDYKNANANKPEFYDAENDLFWWQKNEGLNTLMNGNYKNTDNKWGHFPAA